MIEVGAATLVFAVLAVLVALGVQVAVALGVVGVLGVFAVAGDWHIVSRLISAAAYDGVRGEAFIAIPLFMLMGEFIARSGAVTDVYRVVLRMLRFVPGGAALAGVIGNALYAFVAGTSTASAAGFSRITYPDLRRRGYDRAFALGTLAGGSAIGVLVPPGVLMVAWAILTRQSVGAIFLAALLPALAIAILFGAYVLAVTLRRPELVGAGRRLSTVGAAHVGQQDGRFDETAAGLPPHALESVLGVILLFVAVLGGIGARLLAPVEAASIGAAIGLVLALRKGMRLAAIVEAILVVGRASAPVLLLLFAAQLYLQALVITGAGAAVQSALAGYGSALGLGIMIAVWLLLATVLDSLSIMALTVALFSSAAARLGIDPLAFAVIGILALEAAQLIPPFGLIVYAAKAAVEEDSVAILDVFKFAMPILVILLAGIILLAIFPKIAIWLPYIVS
ncbi:MAG: TRAP transporter large permease subunit [Pseudolabrys sp.]